MPSSGSGKAFGAKKSGDSLDFLQVSAEAGGAGKPGIAFGTGAAIRDTNLYRDGAHILKTDDTFVAQSYEIESGFEETTRDNFGLGSASVEDVGTGVGNVAQIGSDGMLPPSILPESSAPGNSGTSSIHAYRRAATEPSAPAASDFTAANSLITTYASGWSEDFPAGDAILWAVNLRVTGSTVVVGSVGRLTGDTG